MIRKAVKDDIADIAAIYEKIVKSSDCLTGWLPGVYPTADTALSALEKGEMFVYVDNLTGRVRGSCILNKKQSSAYTSGSWRYPAADDEVMVLHTITADPEYFGKGVGDALMDFYEEYAKGSGCSVLRFNANINNTPARKLYEKHGCLEAGTIRRALNGLPEAVYVLYEKKLK
jgi:ribosomal protein S18 acetylase RimI-like enzyme